MLAPDTLEPKLIIQELWKQKLDWNEQLPPDLLSIERLENNFILIPIYWNSKKVSF